MTIPLYSRSSDIRNIGLGSGCEASSVLSWLYNEPEPVWFPRGTAIHLAVEETMRNNLSKDEMVVLGLTTLAGLLQDNVTDMGKHTNESSYRDVVRQLNKWWNDCHPTSPTRLPIWDDYEWPATLIEHDIAVERMQLYTQVDAVFTHKRHDTVAIVDWKSSGRPKADKEQLQIYAYGGRREGWYPNDEGDTVGFFWFLDHSQPGWVDHYPGDGIIEWWIGETRNAKDRMVESGQPKYSQGWQCLYCQSQHICPVNSPDTGLSHEEVGIAIRNATLLIEPPTREER